MGTTKWFKKYAPASEETKLSVLAAVFREMWETADPPCSRHNTQPCPSRAERLAKLDELWQEAAEFMAMATYPDDKEPLVRAGNLKREAERREPTHSDNESCLNGEGAAPERKDPERPKDVQSYFVLPAPTDTREGADAFLEGCRANREWLLDILGDEALLNEMVDEIAAVLYKRHLCCGMKVSYKMVMYALQRGYMNEFMDFLC